MLESMMPDTLDNRKGENCRDEGGGDYWITPVTAIGDQKAETIIQNLVGERKAFAFAWRAHGRRLLKANDWICFYLSKRGVVAHARVATPPQEKVHDWVSRPERYPWVFTLECARLYLDQPTRFDLATRQKLEAFRGREEEENFGWFVRSTHRISKHDYNILTGSAAD